MSVCYTEEHMAYMREELLKQVFKLMRDSDCNLFEPALAKLLKDKTPAAPSKRKGADKVSAKKKARKDKVEPKEEDPCEEGEDDNEDDDDDDDEEGEAEAGDDQEGGGEEEAAQPQRGSGRGSRGGGRGGSKAAAKTKNLSKEQILARLKKLNK